MYNNHPTRIIQEHEEALSFIVGHIINAMGHIRKTYPPAIAENPINLHNVLRTVLNRQLRKVGGTAEALKKHNIVLKNSPKQETFLWLQLPSLSSIHVVSGRSSATGDKRRKHTPQVIGMAGQEELFEYEESTNGKLFIEIAPGVGTYEIEVSLTLMTNFNKSWDREGEDIIFTTRIEELAFHLSSDHSETVDETDEAEFRSLMAPADDLTIHALETQKENDPQEQQTKETDEERKRGGGNSGG